MTDEEKREREQNVVAKMIGLYCKKNHKNKRKELCRECKELLEYANLRSQKCPHIKGKTFCSACKTHCYSPQMREKIRKVMRFSGPRMIFYHPVLALWHVVVTIQQKKQQKRGKVNV